MHVLSLLTIEANLADDEDRNKKLKVKVKNYVVLDFGSESSI